MGLAMGKESTSRLGFRLLSVDTWLHGNPAWSGTIVSMSLPNQSDGWVHDLCQVRLSERVPDPLQRLFEVARGSYAYSLMFYPLLTLGAEQLLRVVEGAIASEFKDKGGPGNRRTFEKRIDWLASERMISSDLQQRLHAVRGLRNLASHPSDQSIFNLSMALSILQITADILNEIFEAGPH
jgi:hypothetical protein